MATTNQRAIAILEAVLNTTSTTAQRNRALAAYGSADALVAEVRAAMLQRIKQYERRAPVDSAVQTAEAAVDRDFPETTG